MGALVRVLLETGAHVTTLAFNTQKHWVNAPSYPNEWGPNIQLFAVDAHTSPTALGAVWAWLRGVPYTVSRFRTSAYASELNRLLRSQKWDVVVADGLTQTVYGPELRAWGGPVVYRAHNVEFRIWEHVARGERNVLKRWYLRTEVRRLRKMELQVWKEWSVKWAITPEDALEMGGYSVPCTVGHWPNDAEMPPAALFHMGALDWLPNVEGLRWFVERVWPLVRRVLPSATFAVLGRGVRLQEFHRPDQGLFAKEANGSFAEVTAGLGISVVPLLSGSGMRIKALDAMTNYKSIVSTSLGVDGIGFIDGTHGWVADDPESFAAAVVAALSDAPERMRRARTARAWAEEKFSDQAVAAEVGRRLQDAKPLQSC